jgi:predicted AAA+ superfamily ATPase
LIKSPKVYWRDSGLLHALLNVADKHTLLSQQWVGASWEGFVIEQTIGEFASLGKNFEAYYFRTSDQYELDLVLDLGAELWAVEVKLSSSPAHADMARLEKASDWIGATRYFLVSQTRRSIGDDKLVSCDLSGLIDQIRRC